MLFIAEFIWISVPTAKEHTIPKILACIGNLESRTGMSSLHLLQKTFTGNGYFTEPFVINPPPPKKKKQQHYNNNNKN